MSESITSTILVDNSYLNQTAHYIFNPAWKYSLLINYPYQFIRSMVYAIIQQRNEAYKNHSNIFDIVLGFVFSKYSTLCLVTALALNDLIISRSPLYNTRVRSSRRKKLIKLSSKAQFIIQLSTVLILLYALCLPFFESDLLKCLFRRYVAFVISYAAATTISLVNHKIPLESADYSLFELTIQYFAFERKLQNPALSSTKQLEEFRWMYLPDSSVCLLNLLIIHVVEYLNLREYRLLMSSILDVINMSYVCFMWYQSGFENIPFVIKYRNFPKMYCTVILGLSLICYGLAILVRWNPWSKRSPYISDLQYYSFITNWWDQLNLTGEEDFTIAVKKFDKLIYSGNNKQLLNYHKELPSIVIHRDDKLILDKYGNFDVHNNDRLANNNSSPLNPHGRFNSFRRDSSLNQHHFLTIPLSWDICRNVFRFFKSRFSTNNNIVLEDIPNEPKHVYLPMRSNIPVHDYFNEICNEDNNDYDEATDEDYILEDILSDQEEDFRYEDEDGGEENLDLLQLILTGTLNPKDEEIDDDDEQYWLTQVTPVIGTHLMGNKRMTRSQYTKSRRDSCTNVEGSISKTINEPIDSLCAICKTNERSIILWPCKCFALCENCRVSLALRGYKKCVYCRQPVSGYSKVDLQE